jgi:uncharacterized protein involved in outer membrane biogenesis
VILKDGILDLDPLNMDVAGGTVNSRIQINAKNDQVVTDYDVRLKNFELKDFLAKAGFADKGHGIIHGRIQLHAPGNSVRESLGNADGTVGIVMNKGEISDLAVALVGIDIGEALRIVASKDKLIPLRCIAVSYDVHDGLMQPQVFVIDTESTLVTGTGNIDLKTEGLGVQLTAEQKSPTFLAAPTPIDITGSFKHPTFGLDTTALAERGAAAAALSVVLTPIGGLLAFIDPGLAENSDCAQEIKEVKQAPEEHETTKAPAHSHH